MILHNGKMSQVDRVSGLRRLKLSLHSTHDVGWDNNLDALVKAGAHKCSSIIKYDYRIVMTRNFLIKQLKNGKLR